MYITLQDNHIIYFFFKRKKVTYTTEPRGNQNGSRKVVVLQIIDRAITRSPRLEIFPHLHLHFDATGVISSVQDGICAFRKADMRSIPSLRSVPNVAFETVPMALSSFHERLCSPSSFHASLLQAIHGVTFLALCPQVVSQAPQHLTPHRLGSLLMSG